MNLSERYIKALEDQMRYSYRQALATPRMLPAELSELWRTDRQAAANFLASLDQRELWVQAIACAAWANQLKGYDPKDGVQTEELMAKFQRLINEFSVNLQCIPEIPCTM